MTESLVEIAAMATALGAALTAGIFFAFSTFVMSALGQIKPSEGVAAMQSINVAVLNPWFFTVFFGTAAACLGLAVVGVLRWNEPGAPHLLAGGALYLFGCILVTVARNVPLNERLAAVEPDAAETEELWTHYLSAWTRWNHLRTAASLAASALLFMAIP
jgi:uncharacterized membrane protein